MWTLLRKDPEQAFDRHATPFKLDTLPGNTPPTTFLWG